MNGPAVEGEWTVPGTAQDQYTEYVGLYGTNPMRGRWRRSRPSARCRCGTIDAVGRSVSEELQQTAEARAASVAALVQEQAAGLLRIYKIYYDSPGSDTRSNTSLNAEYVQVKNSTSRGVSLKGWTVSDASNHRYTSDRPRSRHHLHEVPESPRLCVEQRLRHRHPAKGERHQGRPLLVKQQPVRLQNVLTPKATRCPHPQAGHRAVTCVTDCAACRPPWCRDIRPTQPAPLSD